MRNKIIIFGLLSLLFTPVSEAQEKSQASGSVAHVVIIGVDALRRSVLYELLENNQIPNLGSIFGPMTHGGSISANGDASFNSGYTIGINYCTTAFPSFTFPSWASNFTGTYVKNHGITGNGWFDRTNSRFYGFSASEIGSFSDVVGAYEYGLCDGTLWPPDIDCFYQLDNGGLANSVLQTQTIYEAAANAGKTSTIVFNMYSSKNHASNPYITWIKPSASDLYQFVEAEIGGDPADYDISMMDKTVNYINQGNSPNILTVYFAGHDVNSHKNGVVDGQSSQQQEYYLKNVIDLQIGRLLSALQNSANWDYVNTVFVIIADHGQTDVPKEDTNAIDIETTWDDELEDVFEAVGYDVLDNILEDEEGADSVVGLNGGLAHIYVRRGAGDSDSWQSWSYYPDYSDDIKPLAQAFWDANQYGSHEGELKGALDLILVRKSRENSSWQAPYEVYLNGGSTQSLESYLSTHSELNYYVDALRRISNYNSQRSGDILLISKYDGPSNQDGSRYYFASEANGMHGSLNQFDSYIPLIFAQPGGGGSIKGKTIAQAESVDISTTIASLLEFSMSNVDGKALFYPAGTLSFSDDPLRLTQDPIKKVHIDELRGYVDSLRSRLGWSGYNWTDPVLSRYVSVVKDTHIIELRNAINDIYAALGYSQPDWGEGIYDGSIIKADHINRIRRAIEQVW